MEKNWTDARETCLNINSDLASIKGEEENKFVVAAFFIGKLAWIGLRHGTGVWTDGSNATYFAITLQTSVNLTQRDCYALDNTLQWLIISCSTGVKQAVCKRIGLYKALHLKVTSSLDQFLPPLCITTILSYPSLDSELGRVVRKPVNANRKLKVDRSVNLSCTKKIFTAHVLCCFSLVMLKTKGQT